MLSLTYLPIAFFAIGFAVVLTSRAKRTCSPSEVDAVTLAPVNDVVELATSARRSCFRTTTSTKSKTVRFVTLDNDASADLVSVIQFTVHHCRPLRPVHDSCSTPHVPGSKCGLVYPDGSIKMVKHLGTYHAPSRVLEHRPRCQNLIKYEECFECRRQPVERNTWLREVRPAFAVTLSANVPVFQVPICQAERKTRSKVLKTQFFT